jgi:type III secretion protein J
MSTVAKVRWPLVLLATAALGGCSRSPLYSDLTETQANHVQAALLAAGIDAQKKTVAKTKGWLISVERADIPKSMAVLTAAGLPREPLRTLGDVFPKEGFVSSPLEERARYVFGLSQEVEHTLMQLDGVVEARVHIAIPERNALDDKPPSTSASVVIVMQPGADLESRETDIKAIVTDGVEGLNDINRVTVKFFTRKPPSGLLQVARPADHFTQTAAWVQTNEWGLSLGGVGLLCVAIVGGAGVRHLRHRNGSHARLRP